MTEAVPAIRVWLEPGYDFGRFGAWMLDMPGCFVWRDDRLAALAAVPSRVEQFTGWLAAHGERTAVSGTELKIMEEVAAVPVPDLNTELNATFVADREPVGAADLERALYWLEFARTDLLAEIEDLPPGPATPGVAERSPDREADRPAIAVARHLAFAEVWLTGRMDPEARYAGPGLEADLTAYLEATHAWALQRVRNLAAGAPSMEVVDRRGETWTLAKVLRRLIYHPIDHLDEIRQGSALARA